MCEMKNYFIEKKSGDRRASGILSENNYVSLGKHTERT